MICILHGYLLEGSGSNLWTRLIIQSLCRQGEIVHLFCQENHPELYDFIGEVYYYQADGSIEAGLQRQTPYAGQCIMHKPYIGHILPVYVWDRYEEFSDVQPMIRLSDEQIEYYLENNVRVLKKIIKEYGVTVLHANHAVLMSVVARRVADELSVPFAIMPHGSALEYAVKKDKRFFDLAFEAFSKAGLVFVIGKEIRRRVNTIFSMIKDLDSKMVDLNLGVDTALFKPLSKNMRSKNIELLCGALKPLDRGKDTQMSTRLEAELFPGIDKSELKEIIGRNSNYNPKHTDHDVEGRLRSVDWQNDDILLFVGRLIASKGIQQLIAALPFIFEKHNRAKLIVVGHGPLREPLEALLFALEKGARSLVENMIKWGTELEGSGREPFRAIQYYFEGLKERGKMEEYFNAAQNHICKERVIFTGYLTHRELCYLFPACDAAIFPSIVAEAGPLVFLEAIASGCFPIGTYFAGMAASIDSVAGAVPGDVSELMKISADEKETVQDIVCKVQGALDVDEHSRKALRQIAVEKYDWQNISKRLAESLFNLRQCL
jgi:glycosyltransferase involved in cell wall biosynthesis